MAGASAADASSLSEREEALPYCLRQSAGSGLGLYAARDIAEGEAVLEEMPCLAAVAQRHDATCCASCFWSSGTTPGASDQSQESSDEDKEARQEPPFRTCKRCGISSFCSEACLERALWHPPGICRAYQRLAGRDLSPGDIDDARFLTGLQWLKSANSPFPSPVLKLWRDFAREHLATENSGNEFLSGSPRSQRLLQLLQLLADTAAPSQTPSTASNGGERNGGPGAAGPSLIDLVGVMDRAVEAPADETSAARVLRLHEVLKQCVEPEEGSGKDPGPCFETSDTAAWLSVHERNTFALTAPYKPGVVEVRGHVMYPTAFLLNHSCYPNLCRFDYLHGPGSSRNSAIQLRAMRDIAEGEELLMSYFPLSWHPQDRQDRVKEDYGFTCSCERCELESVWLDPDGESSGGEGDNEESEDDERETGTHENDTKGVKGGTPVQDDFRAVDKSNIGEAGGDRASGGAEGGFQGEGEHLVNDSVRNGIGTRFLEDELAEGAGSGSEARITEGEERRVAGVGEDRAAATKGEVTEPPSRVRGCPENAEEEDSGQEDKRRKTESESGEPTLPPRAKHLMFILKHLCSEEGCKGTISGCLACANEIPMTDQDAKTAEGLNCPFYECNTCGKIWTSQEHFARIEAGLASE